MWVDGGGGGMYIIDNSGQERTIVNQINTGTVSKATLGKTSERRGGAHMGCSERTIPMPSSIFTRNANSQSTIAKTAPTMARIQLTKMTVTRQR